MSDKTPVRYVKTTGRPRKISLELLAEWEKLLPICQYMDSVGRILKVSERTWRRWLKLGEEELERMDNEGTDLCAEDSVLYVEFCLLHKRALAKGEFQDQLLIEQAAMDGAWQAAAWRLERRFPEKYGSQNRTIQILEKTATQALNRVAELEALLFKTRVLQNAEPGSGHPGSDPASNGVAPPAGSQPGGD